MNRRILHMDMDAFFAAVEQKRRPELAGVPVVVGGDGNPAKRGVVSTASYEARPFGIHSAMPLKTAYKLCPKAVFLPVDYGEYSRISRIFKEILHDFSPVMEDVGIDEAFLDLTGIERDSRAIASDIKRRIREATGLTCSIGIAPNKLLAKIGSDLQKPDGLTIIHESDIQEKIWPLAARKLWGVGPKTEAALKGLGIETIGDIASRTLEDLVESFGESYGHYLYQAARGTDDSPLVTEWEPKSMSRETTFQHDIDHWQTIARQIAEITREVVSDLKGSGYRTKNVTLKIRFSDFETLTRAKTLSEATDSEEEIRRAAFECLKRIDLKKKVRLIGVRAGKLEKDTAAPEDE